MVKRTCVSSEIRKDYSFDREEVLVILCQKLRVDKEKVYDFSLDSDGSNITIITRKQYEKSR